MEEYLWLGHTRQVIESSNTVEEYLWLGHTRQVIESSNTVEEYLWLGHTRQVIESSNTVEEYLWLGHTRQVIESSNTVEEYLWLGHTRQVIESSNSETLENTSWAAYHASHQPPEGHVICSTDLLPLFLEGIHTVALIKHSMDMVNNAVEYLNPGQTPVIAFDQPLYALAKQILWKWPQSPYGYGRSEDSWGLVEKKGLGASTGTRGDGNTRGQPNLSYKQ